MVHALLSEGAKVDLPTTEGQTPLYVACHNGHTEVVRALLSEGAKVDLLNKDGLSTLHMVCFNGHTEVARALLSGGAKVDLQNKNGFSPLHKACHCGHIGVVRALLSAGATADLCNINGRTPLDLLPRALRAEVERLVASQQAKVGGGSAKADESRVGAPSAPAVVLPPPHYQPASQLEAASEDGGEGPSERPGGLSAEASSISGRAASERVCSMCGGPPSASHGGLAKLKACGRCRSTRYCSQECQRMHWGEGGHKAACPQLREERERREGVKTERL